LLPSHCSDSRSRPCFCFLLRDHPTRFSKIRSSDLKTLMVQQVHHSVAQMILPPHFGRIVWYKRIVSCIHLYRSLIHRLNLLLLSGSLKKCKKKFEILSTTTKILFVHNAVQYNNIGQQCTANPTWGDVFESSKLKARTSLLPLFSEKRHSSFEF